MVLETEGVPGSGTLPRWVVAALDELPQASVMVFDRDLRFVLARGAAIGRHGYSGSALEGQVAHEALPPERWALYEGPYQAALEGRSTDLVVTAPDTTDSFSVRISPVADEAGEVIGGIAVATDITARVEAERRYRLLAENASDVVMLAATSGLIHWVSPSVEAVLGWAPEDMVGRSGVDFVAPSSREEVRERQALLAAGGQPGTAIIQMLRLDGGDRWMQARTHALAGESGPTGALVIALRDVEEEVATQRQLADSERLFRTVMTAAPIGMYLTHLDGAIEITNAALCDLTARDAGWLVGRRIEDLAHPDDAGLLSSIRARLLAGEDPEPQEVRIQRPDGGTVWVRRVATLIRQPDGSPHRFVVQLVDISAEHAQVEDLSHRAFHDELTGLRNRPWIMDMLDIDLRGAERSDRLVGVLMIDLDEFKAVNDTLGHSGGDEVLIAVGQRLMAQRRPWDRIARLGGDEFIIVIPEVDDIRALEAVADRIIATVQQEIEVRGTKVSVGASVGIAVSTRTSTREQLVHDADAALFRAKFDGRGRWHFADSHIHEQVLARVTMERELRSGLDEHQFDVHFQPIVRLADRAIVAHEALIRWTNPRRGTVAPAEFLALAEAAGIMPEIGDLVLDAVVRLLGATPPEITCALNISPAQANDPNWASRVLDALDQAGVPCTRLVIEVTEGTAINLSARGRAALWTLARRGVGVHLDDFGIGISSLTTLRDLPVSGLKLDRSFMGDLDRPNSAASAVAAGLAGLAAGLGVASTAVGVETETQHRILIEQGWTYAQGFLYGPPGRA